MQSDNFIDRKYYIFLIIFLGLLSAFGPFVTDMYLPTLPSMAEVFHTTASKVQIGLTTSLVGLAVGQIFFGPLSDKYGRKYVLVGALVLFAISTVASIWSPTIDFFNICRFMQGLGGAGGIVMSRSVATDCYSGRELAKTMAIIGGVNGVAPVTAPVIGGLVSEAIGWQGIFWILFGLGVILLSMTYPFEESLHKEKRHKGKIIELLGSFPKLFKIKEFDLLVSTFAFANGILFAYISSSSFIIQNYYGFSELWFSLIFAINAVGIGIGSAVVLKFRKLANACVFGGIGVLFISILQLIFYFTLNRFLIYEGLTFAMLLMLGFIFTSASTMVMETGRKYTGAASAILGASGFLFGGLVSPFVGIGNIIFPTIIILLACSFITCILSIVSKLYSRDTELQMPIPEKTKEENH